MLDESSKSILRPIRIGSREFSPNLFLAPMAGVTDRAFRETITSFGGCGLSYSELLSAEGLIRGQPRTREMLAAVSTTTPFGIQIYGRRPEAMAEAAAMAAASGAALVDINAGCPARQVVRHQGGAFLLKEPALLARIIREVRRAVAIPVTVKIRSGYDSGSLNFQEIGHLAEDNGADSVTLHPRTREQMFRDHSDWSHIQILKAALTIPVIGNGDVFTPADASALFLASDCDAIMIGRGIMKNPWLIRQIYDFLTSGRFTALDHSSALALCLDLARKLPADRPARWRQGEMKKFCNWLVHGFPGAAQHRQALFAFTQPEPLEEYLSRLAASFSADVPGTEPS